MKLSQLRYFLSVMDEGSIARAAARCHVAQPSVAEAINSLEIRLGVTLFERSRRGLRPTAVARELEPKVRRLIDDADMIAISTREATHEEYNLYVHPTINNRRLTQLLVELHSIGRGTLRLTDEADADLVVGPADYLGNSSGAGARELWQEDYRLAVPRNHHLATRDQIRLSDLKGVRFIARCSCERASAFPAEMLQPDIVAVAESEDRALALVAAGLGVSVIPGAPDDCDGVVLRSLTNFSLSRTIALTRRSDRGNAFIRDSFPQR